ncbi:MAG: hypothetical protein AB7N54_19815 [Alphaproteobacteria bacterium]
MTAQPSLADTELGVADGTPAPASVPWPEWLKPLTAEETLVAARKVARSANPLRAAMALSQHQVVAICSALEAAERLGLRPVPPAAPSTGDAA